MSTQGERLVRGGRPYIGVGYSVPPEQVKDVESAIYASFASGLILSDSPENVPQDAGIYAIDMEVNRAGRLQRSPGLTLVEDATPRLLRYTFEQASLDYSTELVTIDPPWFGYKGSTVYTWVNAALAATGLAGWGATNVAGVLLFSNGIDKTYSRQPNAAVVVDQSAQVIARTLAVAFGRTFGGYFTVGGIPQSLGLKWNAANGLYNDWTGIGSGAELLLADVGESDKIVALLSLGLDALGILNRKSLWVGYPTGDFLRPADPRLRVGGIGCVAQETAKTTPGGITFLSDEGVVNFSLTDAAVISEQINNELLSLDYTQLRRYVGAYSSVLQRYYLGTPQGTWIYEFPNKTRKARWFKRSIIPDDIISWSEQSGGLYWDQMAGNWDSIEASWNSLALTASDAPPIMHFMLGTKLARALQSSFSNLGTTLTPIWRTPQNDKVKITDQYTTVGFEISYASYIESQIRLAATTYQDDVGTPITKSLPITNGVLKKYNIWNQSTGMGARCQIEIISGDAEISRIRQMVYPAGPVIGSL